MLTSPPSTHQRIGRLAPSPTGALHVGNIRTFMIAWLQMRSCGGKLLLRIEDLDHPKHKVGADEAIMEELRWLGFDWDGEVLWQSQRQALYEAAFEKLRPQLYPCTCTRADIQRAQSAPHPGEILLYPGTCRSRKPPYPTELLNHPKTAWRLALTPEMHGTFTDGFTGAFTTPAAQCMGDFVVARGHDIAYALAVVVDDAATGVTDIVRGDDILAATPAQVILYQLLGLPLPRFYHVPLVVGSDGRRLAKRHGDTRIATYRQQGAQPGEILTPLARSCGWIGLEERISSLAELLPRFSLTTIPPTPFVFHGL
ncbi:MAG: tRNA glutamyl-Q(34) synthetase GluQRS [bacterium]|nr:tRNA glutamyl-Q(34) synthetase GluQRS [bacterium]